MVGLVGLSGVAVNFVVFLICINGLGLASLRSNIAATLVAITTNYLGYRYWLYKDRDAASRKREITLFRHQPQRLIGLRKAPGLLVRDGQVALRLAGALPNALKLCLQGSSPSPPKNPADDHAGHKRAEHH